MVFPPESSCSFNYSCHYQQGVFSLNDKCQHSSLVFSISTWFKGQFSNSFTEHYNFFSFLHLTALGMIVQFIWYLYWEIIYIPQNHPFKVYYSMVFIVFRDVQPLPQSNFRIFSSFLKVLMISHYSSPLHSQPLSAINLLVSL